MNSNNSLAVKPERENDRIAKIFVDPLLNISLRLKRRLQRDNAKVFSNDQDVEPDRGALRVDGNRDIRCRNAGIFASADRCAAQRHPIRMPLGL